MSDNTNNHTLLSPQTLTDFLSSTRNALENIATQRGVTLPKFDTKNATPYLTGGSGLVAGYLAAHYRLPEKVERTARRAIRTVAHLIRHTDNDPAPANPVVRFVHTLAEQRETVSVVEIQPNGKRKAPVTGMLAWLAADNHFAVVAPSTDIVHYFVPDHISDVNMVITTEGKTGATITVTAMKTITRQTTTESEQANA